MVVRITHHLGTIRHGQTRIHRQIGFQEFALACRIKGDGSQGLEDGLTGTIDQLMASFDRGDEETLKLWLLWFFMVALWMDYGLSWLKYVSCLTFVLQSLITL